jgi:MOSC domain-containing protein YiiM
MGGEWCANSISPSAVECVRLDAQADLAGHGGEQRAVFVYQIDSYHYWERFLSRNDFTFGQFGENFTVEELPDSEVLNFEQWSNRPKPDC